MQSYVSSAPSDCSSWSVWCLTEGGPTLHLHLFGCLRHQQLPPRLQQLENDELQVCDRLQNTQIRKSSAWFVLFLPRIHTHTDLKHTVVHCGWVVPLMFSVCCSYVVEIGGREMELEGCQHICVRTFMQPRCCPQHWGLLCLRKTHQHTKSTLTLNMSEAKTLFWHIVNGHHYRALLQSAVSHKVHHTHWWQRLHACCSSEAIWGSVCCSTALRMLQLAARDSSQRPSDYWMIRSTSWAAADPYMNDLKLQKVL